jgi:hypothetical protein
MLIRSAPATFHTVGVDDFTLAAVDIFIVGNYQEMSSVDVNRTRKHGLLAHSLAKDHDLLKEEARECFHFGRWSARGWRGGKCVEGVEWTPMKEFPLGCDFAFETLQPANVHHVVGLVRHHCHYMEGLAEGVCVLLQSGPLRVFDHGLE